MAAQHGGGPDVPRACGGWRRGAPGRDGRRWSSDASPYPTGEWATIDGVPTILFRRQFSEALKYSAPLAAWLQKSVPSEYDVVHVHALLSHACLAAAAACRANHVPYVVRPLGTLNRWSLAQKPWRKRVLLATERPKGARSRRRAVHYTATRRAAARRRRFQRRSAASSCRLGIDASVLDEAPLPAAGTRPVALRARLVASPSRQGARRADRCLWRRLPHRPGSGGW